MRGTIERTYVMRAAAARISADEVAKMTPDEHRGALLALVAGLIGDAELGRDARGWVVRVLIGCR